MSAIMRWLWDPTGRLRKRSRGALFLEITFYLSASCPLLEDLGGMSVRGDFSLLIVL
jgi:hypothetical protein